MCGLYIYVMHIHPGVTLQSLSVFAIINICYKQLYRTRISFLFLKIGNAQEVTLKCKSYCVHIYNGSTSAKDERQDETIVIVGCIQLSYPPAILLQPMDV